MRASIVAVLCAALAACGGRHRERERERDKDEPPRDAQRARRVIEPSTDRVGPLPPYAIRGDGVGPYKLGEKLSDLLEQLSSGPRIELFEIAGVVHRNVIRAEDDTVLIGGEQGSTASFVAVIGGAGVASTESGIHVGSTRAELLAVLGPAIDEPTRARDPRLVVPTGLPGVRVVLDADRVAAMVVTGAAAPPRQTSDCQRPAATERGFGACLSPAGELVVVEGDELVIRSSDGERVVATPPKVSGLLFAAPLYVAAESRDELVVITRTDEATSRSWGIAAYRLDGTRLVRTVEAPQLYQLSSANARWIGADLREVELYLELASRPDGIEVGGLLTRRNGPKAATKFRDVVVISPATAPRRRGKSAPTEASDAGVGQASTAPLTPRVTADAADDALDPASEPVEPARP